MTGFSGRERVRNFCWLLGLSVVLLASLPSQAQDTVTVDADGEADFTSLDAVLDSIQKGTGFDPEVVLFTGSDQDNYIWSKYIDKSPGEILFKSEASNPAKFAVITHTADNSFNFFNVNTIAFENCIITTTKGFNLGQSRTHSFKKCVIRDCSSSYAVHIEGSAGTTTFENCLFEGNISTNIFDLNIYSGTPTLILMNCTFDNNTSIWSTDPANYITNYAITNCIFSNNTTTFRGANLRGKTTYSLTTEALTGYGTGCKSATDPLYTVAAKASRTAPVDWRPVSNSPARNVGIATGAPTVDLADTTRIQDSTGKRDAGCWDIRDTVQPPSIIKNIPKDTSVALGSALVLKIQATGTAPITYSWRQVDGSATIPSADSMKIAAVAATDDNTRYYCVIKNVKDSVWSDTVLIHVVSIPVITVQPDTAPLVYIGDTATFTLSATGQGLSYAWKKGGATPSKGTGITTATYKFGVDSLADSGSFTCTVTNIAGSVTSKTVVLRVRAPKAHIVSRTADTTVQEGASKKLKVVVEGKEPVSYSWKVPGTATVLSDKDTLQLTSLAVTAGTTYRCIVSNSAGKDSADVKIIVLAGTVARFTSEPAADIAVMAGDNHTLTVAATGGEPLSYKWYKDGMAAADSVGTGTSYAIMNAAAANSGMYYCIVSNSIGSDTAGPVVFKVVTDDIYNLLVFSAQFVSPTRVRASISNFRNLPSSEAAAPRVDSIGIWYNYLTYPSAPLSFTSDSCVKFSLQQLLGGTGDTFSVDVDVPLADGCSTPLYLVAAPHWKEPDSIPSFLSSAQRTTVTMCDPDTLENLLVINVSYPSVSDSLVVTISNLSSINRDSLLYLVIDYKKGTGTYTAASAVKISKSDLPDGDAPLTRTLRDAAFTGVEDSVRVRVRWRGTRGNFSSPVSKSVTVGMKRPENSAVLSADSTKDDEIYLHWSFTAHSDIDSIRIWWGRQALPTSADIDPSTNKSLTLAPDQTNTVLQGLSTATRYYIGLQVQDNGLWSFIPLSAQDTISTENPFGNQIPNTVKVTEAVFDSTTNLFTVKWNVDTAGTGPVAGLETGIVWAVGAPPAANIAPTGTFGLVVGSLKMTDNSVTVNMGENLQFSSIYHFALLLRPKNGSWTVATDSSSITAATTAPGHQVISYFVGSSTSASVFNGQVQVRKVGEGVVSVTDTVRIFNPGTPEGFIITSIGVDFAGDVRSDPVALAMSYDTSKLAGFPHSAQRIYQYDRTADLWKVIEVDTVDSANRMISFVGRLSDYPLPFIVMIDTTAPVVTITSKTNLPVQPGISVRDTLVIADNVSNSSIGIYYWNTYENGGKATVTVHCDAKTDTVITTVPGDSIISDWGVKAKLVVNDGRFISSYDISRSVIRTTSDPVILKGKQWNPVVTTALLDDPSVEKALGELCENKPWFYDSTRFRIFRWYDTSTAISVPSILDGTLYKWLEYSSSQSPFFTMVPGRVLWVKTGSTMDVKSLGTGTTVSLKENYTLTIKAHQWTDVALPYKFNIAIGDVITATGAESTIKDSIYIYSWTNTQPSSTSPKFISTIPALDSMQAQLSCTSGEDGLGTYSILNVKSEDIILRIPPLPEQFSSFRAVAGAGKKTSASRQNGKGWSVSVKSATPAGGELSPVYCGYTPGTGISTYPVSPSFGKQRVTVLDPVRGTAHGHLIMHERSANGFVYQIRFVNEDPHGTMFSFNAAAATVLPDQYRVHIYDPSARSVGDASEKTSLSVDGSSSTSRWLLVGDSVFVAAWSSGISRPLALVKVFPNPCRGEMRIQFTMPVVDIHGIQVSLFDQLGRRVWYRTVDRSSLHAGTNSIRFNPGAAAAIGAGTYILRLTAFEGNGRVLGKRQERILYIP